MNLSTVRMDPAIARVKFLEYRRAVRERHQEEDKTLMQGYRALARGQSVIQLSRTLRAGGYTPDHLPRLAVMRCGPTRCAVEAYHSGRTIFRDVNIPGWSGRPSRFRIETALAGWPWVQGVLTERSAEALVPTIPPAHRPAGDVSEYFVLWEAEWTAKSPVDPALLKHISGDFYAVVSTWDLTELEQLVLGRGAARPSA